jgi:putative peptidoglycan binding protein
MDSRLAVVLVAAGCLTTGPAFAQSSGTSTPPGAGTPPAAQSSPAQPGSTQPSQINQESPAQGTTPTPPGAQGGATTQSGAKKAMPSHGSMKTMKQKPAEADGWANIKNDHGKVTQLQEALKAKGQDPGPVDGVMGPRTMAALRSYQQAEKVSSVDDTLAKLGVSQ